MARGEPATAAISGCGGASDGLRELILCLLSLSLCPLSLRRGGCSAADDATMMLENARLMEEAFNECRAVTKAEAVLTLCDEFGGDEVRPPRPARQCSFVGKWGNFSPCASLGFPTRIWWTTSTYQYLPHGLPHAQGRSFIACPPPSYLPTHPPTPGPHCACSLAHGRCADFSGCRSTRSVWRRSRGL